MDVAIRRHTPLAWSVVLLTLAVQLASCDKDDETSPPVAPVVACTSGQPTGPYPGGGASRAQPVGISGGTFTASVSVDGNCQWTASSDSPWLVLAGAGTLRGSQTLAYLVPSNAGGSRVGRLTYSVGSTLSTLVVQDGAVSCATEISPTARSFFSRQSAIEVRVYAPTDCHWAFQGNGSWLTVVPEEDHPSPWGQGNGTVLAIAAANTDSGPRTGTATIAGKTLTITQDGTVTPACQYSFTPTTHSFPAAGGTGQVVVDTGADCTWILDEIGDSWIKAVTSGRYFRGLGIFQFSVERNTGAARTGMFWLSGTSANTTTRVTIQQAGA